MTFTGRHARDMARQAVENRSQAKSGRAGVKEKRPEGEAGRTQERRRSQPPRIGKALFPVFVCLESGLHCAYLPVTPLLLLLFFFFASVSFCFSASFYRLPLFAILQMRSACRCSCPASVVGCKVKFRSAFFGDGFLLAC